MLQYSARTVLFGFCAVLSLLLPTPSAASSTPHSLLARSTEVSLAKDGEGLFPFYRIVGLASLGNGVVLASFDGRPTNSDAPGPNSILQRRSTDYGKTWGGMAYIAKGQEGNASTGLQQYGFSDPSYVVDHITGTVFNFHVFSKNQGFAGSVLGNNDSDLNILSAEISVSNDMGIFWSTDPTNQPHLPPIASNQPGAPPLITRAVKPLGTTINGVQNVGGVLGTFASSGEGIQLRYGPHAGRLIQQYAGRVIQSDGSVATQAYSVYSDDGGLNWRMGQPVGTGMDENKVVELSNGNVMLNSRPSDGTHYRKVAVSTDGGETYSAPKSETQLPDPANNAAIARMYPDAAQGSKEAKILLFTNADSMTQRVNGTIRYSCDDGQNWSSGKRFRTGSMDYSTVTALGDGTFGIFYEIVGTELVFAKVDKEYIGASC